MNNLACVTPLKKSQKLPGSPLFIPPTPFLQNLGYGTGIEVYRIDRSPLCGAIRSPWAIKRMARRNFDESQKIVYDARINEEASVLRTLDHPNIVGFRGLPATNDGRTTLAMEICDTSLGNILENRKDQDLGPLPAASIFRVCSDILQALNYLHTEAHILHGDMKSYNILAKQQFNVCKLCDFGVSLPLNSDGLVDVVKKPNARYVGTNLWSAPETLIEDNTANISSKADIFSFGLVIYECIALIPPHSWALMDEDDGIIELDDSDIVNRTDDGSIIDLDADASMQEDIDLLIGTRPPLPESDDLPNTYNSAVEMFYVCTNPAPEFRPTASCLLKVLSQRDDEKVEDNKTINATG